MSQKKKINPLLMQVLTGSVIFHVLLLLGLGGVVVYKYYAPAEADFEEPPLVVEETPPPEVKIEIKPQTQPNVPLNNLRMRQVDNIKVSSVDVNLPDMAESFTVSAGLGSGLGGNLLGGGAGKIGLGMSDINFFGLKSKGEKIFIVVDASKWMLEDKRGGVAAYNIVKQEVERMVQRFGASTLFNIAFYDGSRLYAYKPTMVPASVENKNGILPWMLPINKDKHTSVPSGNMSVKDVEPLKDVTKNFAKAVQAGYEMKADTIFIMTCAWQSFTRKMTAEERAEYDKDYEWTAENQVAWDKATKDAQEWLAKENAERKKKGQPERVVVYIETVIREMGVRIKKPPNYQIYYDEKDVLDTLINAKRQNFPDGRTDPSINIVFYATNGYKEGSDKAEDKVEGQYKELCKRLGGKFRVLEGGEALKNVTSSSADSGQ